jgi:cob(I)alamin adenosyltransferase
MAIKPGKNLDELCYPFIYEASYLCDYEVLTDELCGHIGMACSVLDQDIQDIADDLARLQPLAFHANGSIRGKLALEESDLDWIKNRLTHYKQEVKDRAKGFVLPRGTSPMQILHQARSTSKKAIRALVRVEQQGAEIPMIVPRFLNLVCNFCFVLTQVINKRRGLLEPEFISKSYGR